MWEDRYYPPYPRAPLIVAIQPQYLPQPYV